MKTEQIPVDKPIPENLQQRQFVAQGFYSLFREKAMKGEVYSAKESILFTTTALPGVILSLIHISFTVCALIWKLWLPPRRQ